MSYRVSIQPAAFRELGKLPKNVRMKLRKAIDGLAEEPRPRNSAIMKGVEAYRLRIGSYRIIYAIKDEVLVVLVVKVAHRRDAYRDMEPIKQSLRSG